MEEIWNKRDLSVIPEVISPDFVMGDVKGLDGFEQAVKSTLATTPDFHTTIDEVIGDGDTLMVRITNSGHYTGKAANIDISNKEYTLPVMLINRYKDGKCYESTSFANILPYMQQLGIPMPPEWGMG
jgi:predicted ester cyclase